MYSGGQGTEAHQPASLSDVITRGFYPLTATFNTSLWSNEKREYYVQQCIQWLGVDGTFTV